MVTVCLQPPIFVVLNFVSPKEQAALIRTARKRLEAALVSGPNGKEVLGRDEAGNCQLMMILAMRLGHAPHYASRMRFLTIFRGPYP